MTQKKREKHKGMVSVSYRRQLADQFRQRADKSADIVRGLLFAISAGSTAFLAARNYANWIALHYLSIALFVLTILLVVVGWDIQKAKSIRRYVLLRDKGYEDFIKYENKIKERWWMWNQTIDRASMTLVTLAFTCAALTYVLNRAAD